MKNLFITLFACLFFFGCQSATEEAAAEQDGNGEVEVVDLRPDPENPVGENLTVPSDWHIRLDQENPDVLIGSNPDSSDIYFVSMVPGWHVTSGPAGVYYHPHSTAEGEYEANLDVFLFDPGDRREAFGMFIGGQNLDGADQTYDYFLIRNSGEFLIKRRTGEETSVIQDWTASDAIVRYTDPAESSVLNKLQVQVDNNSVAFLINAVEVARLGRDAVQTDGLVGFRVNHALNLHISNLAVVES